MIAPKLKQLKAKLAAKEAKKKAEEEAKKKAEGAATKSTDSN